LIVHELHVDGANYQKLLSITYPKRALT